MLWITEEFARGTSGLAAWEGYGMSSPGKPRMEPLEAANMDIPAPAR